MTHAEKNRSTMPNWITSAAVAAATAGLYFLTARFCLILAIPPGYSSIIWLPAGIALLAVTVWKRSALPGVFVGSFLANYTNTQVDPTTISLLGPVGVGLGAAAQTFVAWILVGKLLARGNTLRSGESISKFFLYAGPVSCIVSPVISCTFLYSQSLIPGEVFVPNFLTWWLGDTVGALVLAPFIFVMNVPDKQVRSQRMRLLFWPVTACLLVTFAVYFKARSDADTDVRNNLRALFDSITDDYERSDIRYTDLIYTTKTLFTAEKIPTREQFNTFGKAMLSRYPGLEGISWVPVVPHQQRSWWEQAGKAEGIPNFRFQAADERGERITSPVRDIYRVIFYNVNKSGNYRPFGFDLTSDPKRNIALMRTDETGVPEATPMLEVVVGSESRLRSVIYLAIRQGEMKHEQLAANGHPTMAYIALALETDAVISGLTGSKLSNDFSLTITDNDSGTRLFSWGTPAGSKEPQKFTQTASITALTQHPWTFTMTPSDEYLTKNRSYLPWYLLIAGMLATAMASGFLLTLTGKTEAIQEEVQIRRAAEAELARSNQDLKRREQELEIAKRNAEHANQAKSSFLANMSHEIRTPLAAVLGYAELLGQPAGDPDRHRYRETIKRNGKMLTTIISDILDFSSIEAGKLAINISESPLHELLADVDAIMRPAAATKGLLFEVKKSDDLPATMATDPDRFRQILLNVVGNAVKFTEAGKVSVTVSYLESSDPPLLRIRVDDTGPGIDPEKKDLLFRPFSQLDESLNRKHGGTGLGLALSRWLARYLGGDIIQQNLPGGGSRFEITVAAALSTNQGSHLTPVAKHQIDGQTVSSVTTASISGRHILLVDDTEDIRTLISEILGQKQAKVIPVASGQDALKAAGAAKFDVILLDLQMPVMGGFDTFKALRHHGIMTPVVAITAHAGETERRRCLDSGFAGVVTKPLAQNELLATIAHVIRS